MKKSIVIIIFSIFAAFLFLPGGYGSWTDELIIKGNIAIVQPTPTPTPTPMLMLTSIPELVLPVADDINSTIPTNNTVADEAGLPNDTGNDDSTNPGMEDQGGSVPDSTQEDSSDITEENTGDSSVQQEEAAADETTEDNTEPEDVQKDNAATSSGELQQEPTTTTD